MRPTFAAFTMTFVAAIACSRDQPSSGSPAAGPSGSASLAATPSSPNDGTDPKAPVPPPAAAVMGSLECRAHGGGQTTELYLDWQQNIAKGSLRVITVGGGVTTKPVEAELYKGLVLVDPAGSPPPVTGKVATMQTDPKKTLQLGDYKQPWCACD